MAKYKLGFSKDRKSHIGFHAHRGYETSGTGRKIPRSGWRVAQRGNGRALCEHDPIWTCWVGMHNTSSLCEALGFLWSGRWDGAFMDLTEVQNNTKAIVKENNKAVGRKRRVLLRVEARFLKDVARGWEWDALFKRKALPTRRERAIYKEAAKRQRKILGRKDHNWGIDIDAVL